MKPLVGTIFMDNVFRLVKRNEPKTPAVPMRQFYITPEYLEKMVPYDSATYEKGWPILFSGGVMYMVQLTQQ